MPYKVRRAVTLLCALVLFCSSSCRSRPGWGILLWAVEEEGIPSGAVLPVYIKSNIEKVWVVGIPREYRTQNGKDTKIEIPLPKLELVGSKSAAQKRALEFSEYALTYAETLQDGLSIRDAPDNGARRLYRLRIGEVIKIIRPVDGNPAIGATGDPLPGEWYRVLTEDGTKGYCFSYRLKLFEHTTGPLYSAAEQRELEEVRDLELESALSRTWVAEIYGVMLEEGTVNIEAFSKRWGFFPGEDTGIARIFLNDIDLSFPYSAIRPDGNRSWRFEGSSLSMRLRSPTSLSVQFDMNGRNTGSGWSSGSRRTAQFINLPTALDDLIVQEEMRREALFNALYIEGPIFSSASYGRLYLNEKQEFLWEGLERLIPSVIPSLALERGRVEMRLFLPASLAARYTGAFTFKFKSINGPDIPVNFLYTIDSGGVRLEYVPDANIDGSNRVISRDSSPVIVYFYQAG